MINAISGKPGGGKSLFAVMELENELRFSDRIIVTNLFGLDKGQIAEDMHKKFGDSFDVLRRIVLLDDEKVAKFWLFRDVELADSVRPDFTLTKSSVCYILDEFHLFFSARKWQTTGEAAIFYASQHRKLGDRVIWITQFPGLVEKQFRLLTQDFTYVRNHLKEKVLTYFRSYPWMSFKVYLEIYTGTQTPMEVGRFRCDVNRYGKWYKTDAGVGIVGRTGADTKDKVRALPIWLLPVAAVVLVLLLVVGISKASGSVSGWLTGSRRVPESAGVVSVPVAKTSGPPVSAEIGVSKPETRKAASQDRPGRVLNPGRDEDKGENRRIDPSREIVFLTGVMTDGAGVKVFLSDGREYRSGVDRALLFVARDYCIVQHEGKPETYRMRNMLELIELHKKELGEKQDSRSFGEAHP